MDNSNLSTFATCPRSGFYKILRKRRLKKSRAALFFGSAIHKALETRDIEQAKFVTAETEEKMIDALIEKYEDVQLDDQEYRNLDYAIRTIKEYNRVYRFDNELAITLPDGKVAVELPFALHVGDIEVNQTILVSDPDIDEGKPTVKYFDKIRVIFTGKIDRVCQKNGEYFVFDHKTTSMGGPTFFDEFYTSLQFKGYKWAVEQILGIRITGVIINGLVCRPPLKNGGVNFTFDRHEIYLDDSLIHEWQTTFMLTVQEAFNSFLGQSDYDSPEQAFPMRTNWCIAKYGRCEYFDACQLPVNQRELMINSGLYEEHTWSPLEEEAKPNSPAPTADSEQAKLTIAALFGR